MTHSTFSVEKAEDSTGFLLWQVTNLWQREIKKSLESYNLTHSQFVLLASMLWLSQTKEDVTQIILSSHTKIDPMTTSTVLRTLERKGLIERIEHSTDSRAKTVSLTKEGVKVTQQAVKTIEGFDQSFFKSLGKTTKEFNHQLQMLLNFSEETKPLSKTK
jgi:DNA-binding MarR family transcriptional regulator